MSWLGNGFQDKAKALADAYASMYEDVEIGGRIAGWRAPEKRDGEGAKQGAPSDPRSASKKAEDEKEQSEIAKKAKANDPLAKQQAQKEAARQKAKDAAAKAGIDRLLGKNKEDADAKRKAQLKKKFGRPGINQGLREDIDQDMEIIDEYSVSVEDGIQLEEGKKKCKEGYKYDSDKKKCVKKKSSSSKSSKTTIIVGRGYGYGGGHHHHDDDGDKENESGGGSNGGDGGGDGGGGE